MQFRSNQNEYLVAFSYASLTDVVLQLLIFFLLSSAFVIQSGVKVQLPKAAAAEQETKSSIVVSIDGNGGVFLNAQPVTLDELSGGIRTLLTTSADQLIILQADKSVSLQRAVDAMDAAKAGGGTRFLIATEPVEPQ
jgi:biopolymer transport protein ExbD